MADGRGATEELRAFRGRFYGCLGRRVDALFELTDAMLASGTVPSPVHLSLAAVHRRRWGSLYAALWHGAINEEVLREVLAHRMSSDEDGESYSTSVYAVDQSVWSRCDAEARSGRGYYYHPSRHSAGQPIVAGWAYQLVAKLGFSRDSWVTPADVKRVKPEEDANDVAAEQVNELLRRLPERDTAPLFVFDAGYDPVKLQRELRGERPVQLLVRLHSNRVFYADPEDSVPKPVGRPRRHGEKFDLGDPETWPDPSAGHRCESEDYGSVRVRAWNHLHPKTRHIGERYGCEKAPVVKGTVVLVEVDRLPKETRKPKKLWLWWHGEGEPDLNLLWRAYCRRFSLEHAIRFWKERLGWTKPELRHPEQADLWTWLVVAAYAQLGLARGVAADRRLPWEKPLPPRRLTPTRVLRAFRDLLPTLSSPRLGRRNPEAGLRGDPKAASPDARHGTRHSRRLANSAQEHIPNPRGTPYDLTLLSRS